MAALISDLRSITVEQLEELSLFHRETIPHEYMDVMGHMNIVWYMALFDRAGWKFFASFGMDEGYYRGEKGGAFALQHFINYLTEVRAGETVAVRIRMLERSNRRMHFMAFLINETHGVLAATLEALGTHAGMENRRTSSFPTHIAERIDEIIAENSRLNWQVPVSGIIKT